MTFQRKNIILLIVAVVIGTIGVMNVEATTAGLLRQPAATLRA